MKNGERLNEQKQGTELYAIEFTPKGEKKKIEVFVWAKNRLDASNYLILNKLWGKQHSIKIHTAASVGQTLAAN